MRPKMIYYETMAVQWVSEGMSRFFEELGYKVISNTVQEKKEAYVPLDRIYAAKKQNTLLLFALQFKTPYQRNDVICWRTDPTQHEKLSSKYFSQFIWYCFPFMKEMASWKNALHHSHFVCPSICSDIINWFIWDDYFLYFYPGRGGCRKFVDELRSIPCGNIPYDILNNKLARVSKSGWNYTMNYDSWGSLYYKLLRSEMGYSIRNKLDWEKLMDNVKNENKHIDDPIPCEKEAIIILLDVINKTVDAVNIISGPECIELANDNIEWFPITEGHEE
jgi:hypothetical protein